MRKISFILIGAIALAMACKSSKKSTADREQMAIDSLRMADSLAAVEAAYAAEMMDVDTASPSADYSYGTPAVYRPSRTRYIDIIHTKLDVKFDFDKQHLIGKAWVTARPYFYATGEATLDARGFEILGVFLTDKTGKNTALKYDYDNEQIKITLDRQYKNNEEFTVFVNYIAKPDELPKEESGEAIHDNKGLYFINPKLEDKDKPRQIWTQGETQSNSAWFPTFDSPNERMTQEIIMTVDTQYVTLSNGKLISSKVNKDGTRTDTWKQTLGAAPYLTMMAVGEFAVVKDKWRNLDVNYYVEKDYAKYAKLVFGNTPKMIEFYSKKLGVDYPWEKFSQIVVRDFVSGAMENTSAVVHFDALQHDDREHLDNTWEDVISHELFHHWFGDLVTCESWANVPLNESFATYGEYMWREYYYGRMEADQHLKEDLGYYLQESAQKKVNLIRYDYDKPDDMFDRHSYQKGGRVLHMLRKYVGDSAFFKSLNLYLTKNKFKSAEIADLRLAFEETTGEDLNWFFNQWFMSPGHPVLEVNHDYDENSNTYLLHIDQTQYDDKVPQTFRLPVKVDIYEGGNKRTEEIVIDMRNQNFEFPVSSKVDLVVFDAEEMLLCEKNEYKSPEQWMYQLKHAPLYLDKDEALDKIAAYGDITLTGQAIDIALADNFWAIRLKGLEMLDAVESPDKIGYKDKLIRIVQNDKKADVRDEALDILASFDDKSLGQVFRGAANDSSYNVSATALEYYAKIDSMDAVSIAEKNVNAKNMQYSSRMLTILAQYGHGDYLPIFEKKLKTKDLYAQYLMLQGLSAYLVRTDADQTLKGLKLLETVNVNDNFFLYIMSAGLKAEVNKKYTSILAMMEAQQQLNNDPKQAGKIETVREIVRLTSSEEEED